MWAGVDLLSALVFDALLAAAIVAVVGAVGVIGCHQPARRVRLVRAVIVGLLLLVPIKLFGLAPTFSLNMFLPRADALANRLPAAIGGVPAQDALGWLTRGLTLAYLAGIGLALGWLALGHLGLVWLMRRSVPPGPVAAAIYEQISAERVGRGGRRRPALRVSLRVQRPVVVSRLLGALILIPPDLDPELVSDPASEALRLGLLHELAHAAASDPRFSQLGRLVRAFWYVLPPVWWLTSVMRLDQEFLADRLAARRFGTPGDYASRLLDLASSSRDGSEPIPQATATASPSGADSVATVSTIPVPAAPRTGALGSSLFHRMTMLLHCPFAVEAQPPRWWVRSVAVSAAMVTVAASCLTLRPDEALPTGQAVSAFQLISLEVPARPSGSLGRAPLFELPLLLPDQFDLEVEVWGDPESLALTRVAGLPLGLLDATRGARPAVPPAATWHTVHLHRDGRGGITLQLDDQLLLVPAESINLTTWLSLEPPPDREGRFRFLNLVW